MLIVLPKNLRRQFLVYFSPEEIAEIFGRSHLRYVRYFLQYNYQYVKQCYVLSREQLLATKLASSSLQEIGKFIHRIKQIREEVTNLANEAFGLLITIDLPRQLSNTDTHQPKKLHDLLETSDLLDIELFLGGMADVDTQYLQIILQCLEASKNLIDKLAAADVGNIGYFLWNVYAVIDKDLAQAYSKLVDEQGRSSVLGSTSLESLCRFLWNLTHISDLPKLQTVDNPTVIKRLQEECEEHIGWGMALLGTLSITSPTIARDLQLPTIETQTEQLGTWLIQLSDEQSPHPHFLSLTLQGLRSYDELEAQAIVRASLDLTKAAHLLEDALAKPIVTPRTMVLLRETIEWLGTLSTHPHMYTHEQPL